MKIKHWITLIISILLFIVCGIIYFSFFNIQHGFTLPSVTIGLPLLVGMFLFVFYVISVVRHKDIKQGQKGFVSGIIIIVISLYFLPYMGSFILSYPANAPATYEQTEDSLILRQVLKEYTSIYRQETDYCIFYPEFTDSYRNLTGVELEVKSNRIKKIMIDKNINGVYPRIFDEDTIIKLVDSFITVNLKPGTMSIRSAPADKYFIDYDHVARIPVNWDSGFLGRVKQVCKFSIDKIGTQVSRLFYNEETGLLIIDIQKSIYVFYYQDDQVKLIHNMPSFYFWEL
jgi:hypothetical protein